MNFSSFSTSISSAAASSSTTSFLILLLIIILVVILHLIITKSKTTKNIANLPPGCYGWPVLGETLSFLRAGWDGTPERFVMDRVVKYGGAPVFKTSMLGDSMVVFYGTAGNKFLFQNEDKLVASWWPRSVKKLLGTCLASVASEEAKWLRKMLYPFLSPDAFGRLYINTMDTITQKHITDYWQGKREVKVYPTVKLYAFELACRLFMSFQHPKQIENLASQFNIFLKGVIQIPLNIPGTRFYCAMRAVAAIRKELLILIKQRKIALEQNTASPSQDLLSKLLVSCDENGRFLTEAEIVNNIMNILFAGHDTSTISITLLMKTRAEMPQVYEKVYQVCALDELENMDIAASKGPGELLQWDDIQKMKYSWNVVCEVMRISPPVFGGFREVLVDFTYAGYTIPKGWKLYWCAGSTQKDEKLFPNPTNFDASRFEGAGPTPYSYVPFGGGPRMCLGKEFARLQILVFLHNMVKRFKWGLVIPDEKFEYDPMPTPVKGLPVHLQPHSLNLTGSVQNKLHLVETNQCRHIA